MVYYLLNTKISNIRGSQHQSFVSWLVKIGFYHFFVMSLLSLLGIFYLS